jgi:DHA1 family multidrug resistance protein-like MFS transporter
MWIIKTSVATSPLGWRWVFWVMMISAGACTVFGLIFLPETYAPTLLARKVGHLHRDFWDVLANVVVQARRLRKLDPVANKHSFAEGENKKWTLRELLGSTIIRPITMIAVEPILLLVTVYMSVVYGIIYGCE